MNRPTEALQAYDLAIALAPDDPSPHNGRGNVLCDLARYLEALAAFQAAVARDGPFALPHNGLGNALAELGRGDEALERLLAALRLAERSDSSRLQASAHRALLLLYLWTGPPEIAVEHGERALELAGELGDSVLSFWAHWAMAILGGLTGDLTRTTRNLERCHELAEELGSPLLRMWTAEIAIEFAFGEGRWDEGLALGENAISMARALHQPMLLPRLLVWTALIHLGRGDIDRGRAFVDEAWTLSGAETERPASVHIVIAAYIGRAAWHLAIGEYERAIAVAEAGLDVVDRTGYIVWAIHRLLPIAAESALYLRDLDRAAEFGSRLRECSERFDHRLGIAWADACDALTVWLNGDPAAGASLMRRAAEALEAIPSPSSRRRCARRHRTGPRSGNGRPGPHPPPPRPSSSRIRLMMSVPTPPRASAKTAAATRPSSAMPIDCATSNPPSVGPHRLRT
jgi:tetratricopeptide (TPR) repeat protein